MNEIICIHHANCMDGFGSAWVVRNFFKDHGVIYIECHYDEDYSHIPNMIKGKDVFVVDFAFKREIMIEYKKIAKWLMVLDHHKTSKDDCAGLDFCHFDMTRSGAMLTWNYFYPDKCDEKAPLLIQYIQDRDLWHWHLPESAKVNAVIGSYEKTFENYDILDQRIKAHHPSGFDVLKEGETILRLEDMAVKAAIKPSNLIPMMIAGHKVFATNNPNLISRVAGELAKSAPFGVAFFMRPDGLFVFSLRSVKSGVDVSEIAKSYGGGGHLNAAGFTTDDVKKFIVKN